MSQFRFEELEIWKLAIEVGDKLFDISDHLYDKHFYRFSEQLKGASMSIANNIAEGSGSNSNKEFAHYINLAHRSTFECANIITILLNRKIIDVKTKDSIFIDLETLSKKLTSFRKSLK
jgi:four helix bundle protein